MPSRLLLEQFGPEFPEYCKVGMGYNKGIDFGAQGFLAITDSVHRLQDVNFELIVSDEAHHPIPPHSPNGANLFEFSATHTKDVDFRYSMGEAIEDGILCDYDLTVPVTTKGYPYQCLASMLLSQAGRFRRVLAFCNSLQQSKRFQQVLLSQGIAAWQMDANTRLSKRQQIMAAFLGPMQEAVHVLVTVQVLGEGVNIPNADTCLFVEPRNSYTSIIQAVGRVLRSNGAKPLAHIVLPAVAIGAARGDSSGPGTLADFEQRNSRRHSATRLLSHRLKAGAYKVSAYSETGSQAHRFSALQSQAESEQQNRQRPHVVQEDIISSKALRKECSPTNTSRYTAKLVEDEVQVSVKSAERGTVKGAEQFALEAQLERFMAVLAKADHRLQTQPLRCRVWVLDSRFSRSLPFRAQVRGVFRILSRATRRPADSWQRRFQALETFAAENGHLPRLRSVNKGESALAKWLANVGSRLKEDKLAASRVDRLSRTASNLIRSRVQSWLDKDLSFKLKCDRVMRFINRNGALPAKRQVLNKDSEEYLLGAWLLKIKSGTIHMNPHRFQLLTGAHPLLADMVWQWEHKKIDIRMDDWMKKAQVLKEVVSRTGRLPSQMIDEEKPSYLWMMVQKHRFRFLPDAARAELVTSPILAAFLRQA